MTLQRRAPVTCLLLLLSACGANEPSAQPRAEPARAEPAPTESAPAGPEPPAAQPQPAAEPQPPPPAEPEPAVVEAGARLGAIRIGMSEEDVRALGLEESEADPRSRRFGPYRVFFDDGAVERVEAQIGALGRVQIGSEVLPSGTHIHRIRDAIGSCEWYEGGGERYRCANGTLFVQTTHTMDPARYTIAVERR